MKNNYFYKLLKVISWPVLFGLGQFLLLLLIGGIYSIFYPVDEFANFIQKNSYLVGIINVAIFIPLFYKKYQTYSKKEEKIKYPIKIILIALLVSSFLNEIILLIKIVLKIEMEANLNLYLLINTIIIGPILEEYLFRGIVLNELLLFNKEKKSIYIASFIFAFMHGNILTILYTFIIGILLNHLYLKEKTIKAPILFHITINFVSSFIIPFLYVVI